MLWTPGALVVLIAVAIAIAFAFFHKAPLQKNTIDRTNLIRLVDLSGPSIGPEFSAYRY